MTSYEKCKEFLESTGELYNEYNQGNVIILEEDYSRIRFIFKQNGSFVQMEM